MTLVAALTSAPPSGRALVITPATSVIDQSPKSLFYCRFPGVTAKTAHICSCRSKTTQSGQRPASLVSHQPDGGDSHVGDGQGVRRLGAGKLRSLYGAVDIRAVRGRSCAASGVIVAKRGFGNRRRHRSGHPRIGGKMSPSASYVVTDLNQPMLDYAASRQAPDSRIKWRQADALALPFEDAAFDLVCCQFGAMFFPDRTSAYREAKRVLKPRRAIPVQRMGPHRGECVCG